MSLCAVGVQCLGGLTTIKLGYCDMIAIKFRHKYMVIFQSISAFTCKNMLYVLSTNILVSRHEMYDSEDINEIIVELYLSFADVQNKGEKSNTFTAQRRV